MKRETTHKAVNWIDGMKINKDHFINSDNFHIEQTHISRRIFLNENNFGILPSFNDKTNYPFDLKLVLEGDTIFIANYSFSLVMMNGAFVSVNSEELIANRIDPAGIKVRFKIMDCPDKKFLLMVKVNPFARIEYGEFDSESLPIRRPFTLPFFEFIISPEIKTQTAVYGDDFFVIAKFSIQNGDIIRDEEYIPPATSLRSLPKLEKYLEFISDNFSSLEQFLLETIGKYRTKSAENNLKDTLLFLASNLLQSLSRIKFEIRHQSVNEPPLDLVLLVKELANILFQSIEIRTSNGKQLFLKEVNTIIGVATADFEKDLVDIISLDYQHYNTAEALRDTKVFVERIVQIFKSISEHDKISREIANVYDVIIKAKKKL